MFRYFTSPGTLHVLVLYESCYVTCLVLYESYYVICLVLNESCYVTCLPEIVSFYTLFEVSHYFISVAAWSIFSSFVSTDSELQTCGSLYVQNCFLQRPSGPMECFTSFFSE
jgi:hypothetical protein